jgi:hypothetical protein
VKKSAADRAGPSLPLVKTTLAVSCIIGGRGFQVLVELALQYAALQYAALQYTHEFVAVMRERA